MYCHCFPNALLHNFFNCSLATIARLLLARIADAGMLLFIHYDLTTTSHSSLA
jgi:hypothetical protein